MHTSEASAIELHGVSVRYRTDRIRSAKEMAIRMMTRRHKESWFYSLRDVSLTIGRGESVGIVGDNGAGKSTLLRVIAGIITPSSGYSLTWGTVAPLIELGTGFEAELTGRENILFNGALLGRTRKYMRMQLDDIVAFSGLEEFIDAPLRTYSTGMVARLAFAVATSVEAETILLDEILSVGDASFRDRCDERIQSFVKRGATIILVAHQLGAVRTLCARSILVSHGEVKMDGPSELVLDSYERERHHR